LASAIVFVAGVFVLWPRNYLLISTLDKGRPILILPLTDGPKFTIGYIHSVDGTPVFEVFTIRADGPGDPEIYIVETYFRMFGAGMGHWAGHGRLVREKGWTRIVDIDKRLGDFILRIGARGVDHTVHYAGRNINLSQVAPGRAVRVRAVRASRLRAWLGWWPDRAEAESS
jgi:hypothetical protein